MAWTTRDRFYTMELLAGSENLKVRWQALVPRAERLLRKWHELQGMPSKGIVFPTPRPSA